MSDINQILADTYLSKNDGDIGELLKQEINLKIRSKICQWLNAVKID